MRAHLTKPITVMRLSVCGLALLSLGSLPAYAAESSLTQGAKKVGTAVGSTVRDVGEEGKKIGLTVGHEAKKVGLSIGYAAKAGGVAAWQAVKGEPH